jgi:hypothetical protein
VKAPVAAAEPAPNGPDLLHLAVRPRTTNRPALSVTATPAAVPSATESILHPPTVVALPGDIVTGALVVVAGPGRAQGHAGGPPHAEPAVIGPVTPIPSPVAAPVAVPVVTPKPKRTDPAVVATPAEAGAPPLPEPVVAHHDDNHEGDGAGNVDEASQGERVVGKSVKHEVRANVERLVNKLRAQVKQAVSHGHD